LIQKISVKHIFGNTTRFVTFFIWCPLSVKFVNFKPVDIVNDIC